MAKVLLVDDDETTRGVIEAILRYEGHEVVLAANGKQGLFVVKETAPDVVLSDIHMPGMTGTEFCREIRKDPALRETYVILATGFDSPESKTEGIAAGADDYVGKPVRADELSARIRLAQRVRGLHRDIGELRKRLGEGDRARQELQLLAGRTKKFRGDLVERLGTVLDTVRRAQEDCRHGELKAVHGSLEKVEAAVEELRTSIAPRDPGGADREPTNPGS
jgi:DNA-binding response OmpR family regulator